MESLYDFYMSLVPGDVITSAGCKGVAKKNEQILTKNRHHHAGWGKYARITDTTPELGPDAVKSGDGSVVGVRWEGIDPSLDDVFAHTASENDKVPSCLRKTNKTERRVFMKEYLKTRIEIADHMMAEAKETVKRMQKTSKALNKIAKAESIDTGKIRSKIILQQC